MDGWMVRSMDELIDWVMNVLIYMYRCTDELMGGMTD